MSSEYKQIRTWREICLGKIPFLVTEFFFKREACLQQWENEDEKKSIFRKIEKKGRSSPTEHWWLSESLANDCWPAWLGSAWAWAHIKVC